MPWSKLRAYMMCQTDFLQVIDPACANWREQTSPTISDVSQSRLAVGMSVRTDVSPASVSFTRLTRLGGIMQTLGITTKLILRELSSVPS